MTESNVVLCGKEIEITEEIHIQIDVLGALFDEFEFITFLRGYHVSMEKWPKPLIGETLSLEIEMENQYDKYAVAAIRNGDVVGHVPAMFSESINKFLQLPGCQATFSVTGKRVNRGAGYGLEIPVKATISGHAKAVAWAKERINKLIEEQKQRVNHNKKTCKHCMEFV